MAKILKPATNAVNAANSGADVEPSTSIETRIKTIMAKVFKMDLKDINEDTSPDTVHRWTSLEHVDFVLNLQREFGIEFTDSQIVEDLLSYKTVVKTIKAVLAEKN